MRSFMRTIFKPALIKLFLVFFFVAFNTPLLAETKETTFFDQNKKKDGIKTLSSGVQYKILKEGSGNTPGPVDYVSVRYKGTFIDGKEFESTFDNEKPVTFPINTVVPGLAEVLQLMKPGARWEVYIPSKLGYGEQGSGKLIPPNTPLVFDIELVSVRPSLDENADGFISEEEAD